jgi:flotillin
MIISIIVLILLLTPIVLGITVGWAVGIPALIGVLVFFFVCFLIGASLYRVVPADYVDVIIQRGEPRMVSSHKDYQTKEGQGSYFAIPSWFFLFKLGMEIHRIPLKILSIEVKDFLAFDQDRARFICDIVSYVAVEDPIMAAKRFSGNLQQLNDEISRVVQATTRDATTKKKIREIINDRKGIIEKVREPLEKAISHWGLALKDIELLEFKDPRSGENGADPSHVISDISSIIEEEINSEARQKNAEQRKIAQIKEAAASEAAEKRKIEKDEAVGIREENKNKMIAEQKKIAEEKRLEVERTVQVTEAEIKKQAAIVNAEEEKKTEEIIKERKRLEGEGDKERDIQKADGVAALQAVPIRETGKARADAREAEGKAEAAAKEALKKALDKFTEEHIKALTAELVINKNAEIQVESAKALQNSNLNVFSGGKASEQGFDLAQLLQSVKVNNPSGYNSLLNRFARPNQITGEDGTGIPVEEKSKKKRVKQQ